MGQSLTNLVPIPINVLLPLSLVNRLNAKEIAVKIQKNAQFRTVLFVHQSWTPQGKNRHRSLLLYFLFHSQRKYKLAVLIVKRVPNVLFFSLQWEKIFVKAT